MKNIRKLIVLSMLLQMFIQGTLAQKDTVIIQYLGKDTVAQVMDETKKDLNIAYTCNFENSKIVTVLNQEFSENGKYCFRRGIPWECTEICPVPNTFEFYADGKLIKRIENLHYKVMSAVSTDGYVAAISVLEKDKNVIPRVFYLSIYTPYGKELLMRKIEGDFMDAKVKVSHKGEFVAAYTWHTSNLYLFNNKGKELVKLDNFDIASSFSFYQNKYLIANGDEFSIINLKTKNIVSVPVNPSVYKIDIENNLVIAIEERNNLIDYKTRTFNYIYFVNIIQFNSGKKLTEYRFPEYLPKEAKNCKINIIDNKNFNLILNNLKYEFKIN
jgi:hypothetical protein